MFAPACSKDYWPATLIHMQSSRACFIQFKASFSRQWNDWSFLFQSYKIQDCITLIWAWSNKMVLKQWIWNPINCLSLSRLNTPAKGNRIIILKAFFKGGFTFLIFLLSSVARIIDFLGESWVASFRQF